MLEVARHYDHFGGVSPINAQVRALIDEQAESYEQPEEVVRWYYSQPQRLAQVEALAGSLG